MEMEICRQQGEIKMRHLPAVDQSIGIDETNTFQLKKFAAKSAKHRPS